MSLARSSTTQLARTADDYIPVGRAVLAYFDLLLPYLQPRARDYTEAIEKDYARVLLGCQRPEGFPEVQQAALGQVAGELKRVGPRWRSANRKNATAISHDKSKDRLL